MTAVLDHVALLVSTTLVTAPTLKPALSTKIANYRKKATYGMPPRQKIGRKFIVKQLFQPPDPKFQSQS